MNEVSMTDQISENIASGRFESYCRQTESGFDCALGISELIKLSMEKEIPRSIISEGALDKAMDEAIKKFEKGDYTIPELAIRAKYTGEARDMLLEQADAAAVSSKGKLMLATVEGEYYHQGKDMIAILTRGIGFTTIDLGMGVPVEDILISVKKHAPDYLAISTSVKTATSTIREIHKRLADENCRGDITTIIDGHLATVESAKGIGADHCCRNMVQMLELLKELAVSPN